jgi:hypothetical protein
MGSGRTSLLQIGSAADVEPQHSRHHGDLNEPEVTTVIQETRPMKAIRNVVSNVALALTLTLTGVTSMAQPSMPRHQRPRPPSPG